MKIRFGLHLDGQQGFSPSNQLGALDVGPLGLLTILESQLGLVPPSVTAAQRTVQFRDCLEQLNNPHRFFHKSYGADDFGTAATLLSWRDQWRLHGWTGEILNTNNPRLSDMAALEKIAHAQVSPGIAERLLAIVLAMTKHRLRIASVVLADPIEQFPLLWQRVLNQLPIQISPKVIAIGQGLLGKLQQTVINAGQSTVQEPINWIDDGTILVTRGETSLVAGRWIAQHLHQSDSNTLYVATSQGATTDAFNAASNFPRQGLSDASAFRPALQLLPLSLELLWQPLNFSALVQFLSHPICPVPGFIRRHLANLQSQYPGTGGPRWVQAIAEIEEKAADRAHLVKPLIDFWIDHPRFDPSIGVPVTTVLQRAERLAEFFKNCPSDMTPALQMAYGAGFSQTSTFHKNLVGLHGKGVEVLRPRQLEQLATQATARGNNNPLHVAQVGALPCIDHPGAVIANFSTVVWGPLEAPVLPSAWPWSKAEIDALKNAGCMLPEPTTLLQAEAANWLRPILAAKDRLVLILAPQEREVHPVWQMLKTWIPNLPIVEIEKIISHGGESLTPISHKPLPQRKRWWHLAEGTVIPPVREYSFTQLERQIFNPFHWLLMNAAQLQTGALLSIPDDFRLKGLISHSLIERLYGTANGLAMNDAEFESWFTPAFDELIAQEGAVYLMPGRQAERENLRRSLHRALDQLREILSNAKVTDIQPERRLSGTFVGGQLTGYSDLVLTNDSKTHAILDMKWSGKSHRVKLAKNRHLQLAIYAELLRQNTNQWPALAYFLISQGKLLTRDDLWFPGASAIHNESKENTAQLWERFLVTWKWRQDQFSQSLFEVVFDVSDADESTPPEDGLSIEALNLQYNDCRYLAGWEQEA